jgi:DNA-binding GntR family transcriptional regulator
VKHWTWKGVKICLGISTKDWRTCVAREDAPYLTIAAELERRITEGEWLAGAKLPRRVDLAREYQVSRTTIDSAVGLLEGKGLVWAVPRGGTVVRYGMSRARRPRGNLVKRNKASDGPGYSFPSASGTEVWRHHVPPTGGEVPLEDPRLARLLGVPEGTSCFRRHRVTGPITEPPFQISDSWIHPGIAKAVPEVATQQQGPVSSWLYHLEKAGHWPLSWMEFHRARLPTTDEAAELQIPLSVPVLEIARVGRSGATGKPVEVTVYVIPSDRVETVQVLERDESAQEPWPQESG